MRTMIAGAALAALIALTGTANAQQPQPPLFATRKVDGTDNVYIFRYQGHQSMFIVTQGRDRHRPDRPTGRRR